MKKILLLLATLIGSSLAVHAQGAIKYPISNPAGTACGGYDFALYQGKLYSCAAGVFAVMPVTPSGNANFVLYPSASPNGNVCSATNNIDPLAQVFAGVVYTCQTGTYQAVAGAGGGGNVSNSGTPTAGQLGVWVTATTIKGVTATQDCSVTSTGVFTCLKSNNVAFGPLATQAGGSSSAAIIAGLTFTPENVANKDILNGYAGLDASVLLKASEFPTPTTTTFGGVKDKAAVANNFITSIVGGVPVQARPTCGNLSDSGTGCSATLATVATSGSATDIVTGILGAAEGGTGVNSIASNGLPYGNGTSPVSVLAATSTNCAWLLQANVTASASVPPAWACPGVATNAQVGTTYTVLYSDRLAYVSFSNASPIAVTLPQAGSTGFASNFGFIACDIGVGTATITPTTSTISYSDGTSYTAAAATLVLTTGQCTYVYSDNTNYFAILRRTEVPVVAGGGNGTVSASSSAFLNMFGAGTPNATENTKQEDFPFTGILRNLCVRINSAQPSSGSLTIILHNATTNADVTGLSVVIAASSVAGKYCDTTNTSAVVAGNDYTWKFTEGVTNISATITGVSAIYRY